MRGGGEVSLYTANVLSRTFGVLQDSRETDVTLSVALCGVCHQIHSFIHSLTHSFTHSF